MTKEEEAYNQGVDECCKLLEAAAQSIPPQHAVTKSGLADLARDMRGLMLSDAEAAG